MLRGKRMLYSDKVGAFLQRVREGRVSLGVHSSCMSPQLIELYGFCKLDFVIIGQEVEALDVGRMEDLLRAANAAGTVPIVKVKRPDPALVSDTMNYGAPLVMVPHVTSAAQLETLVAATRFEPLGTRGECPVARYTGYGTIELADSRTAANTTNTIIPIIEDREAMSQLDAIAAVDGIDIIEIGPFDLSRSLGDPGQGYRSAVVLEAVEAICEAARAHGKAVLAPLWIPPDAESPRKIIEWQMEHLIARGVTLLYDLEVVQLAERYRQFMPMRGIRVRSDAEAEAAAESAAPPASATAEPQPDSRA